MCLGNRMPQGHEKLIAWQRADDLCVLIHQLTHRRLPREERFELASQLRRAAYSVPANIVEGYAFESIAVRLKHLRIAIGSLVEVGYGVHLATRLEYLPPDVASEVNGAILRTAAPLHGLVAHEKRERASQGARDRE
jgi:four helix bundle protein